MTTAPINESAEVYAILTTHRYFNRHTIRAFGRDMGLNKSYSGRHDSNDHIARVISENVTMTQLSDWMDSRTDPRAERTMPDRKPKPEPEPIGAPEPTADDAAVQLTALIRSMSEVDEGRIRQIVRDEIRQMLNSD